MASTKFVVPDLATVPKLATKSALVMPMPVSLMVKVRASLSKEILISSSFLESSCELSDTDTKRILSSASLPFEMTSLRKISLFLYNELIMMSMSRFTSAWNSKVSASFGAAGASAVATAAFASSAAAATAHSLISFSIGARSAGAARVLASDLCWA